jgi:hypothetical protein
MPKAKNPNMGRPVLNKHKVPLKQWNKWSNLAKKVFNDMMESMRPSMQWAFLHPAAQLMPKEHWGTTRWNASWEAANAANGEGGLRKVVVLQELKKAKRKAPKKVSRRPPKPAPNPMVKHK